MKVLNCNRGPKVIIIIKKVTGHIFIRQGNSGVKNVQYKYEKKIQINI